MTKRTSKTYTDRQWAGRPVVLEIYEDGEFIQSRRFSEDDPARVQMFATAWEVCGDLLY